jgi:hypothetical protein
MAHTSQAKDSLVVHVHSTDGKLVAVFICLDETELDKLNNAENLKPPVLINVEHLRLFIGNAVIVAKGDE